LVYFRTKQNLSWRQARWALFLLRFQFIIIHKPGIQNKSDALSRHPDHKKGIADDDEKRVLLDTKFFLINAIQRQTLTVLGDTTLQQRIRETQTYDKEVSEVLNTLLKSGPQSLTKGLEEWNLEDGVILF